MVYLILNINFKILTRGDCRGGNWKRRVPIRAGLRNLVNTLAFSSLLFSSLLSLINGFRSDWFNCGQRALLPGAKSGCLECGLLTLAWSRNAALTLLRWPCLNDDWIPLLSTNTAAFPSINLSFASETELLTWIVGPNTLAVGGGCEKALVGWMDDACCTFDELWTIWAYLPSI